VISFLLLLTLLVGTLLLLAVFFLLLLRLCFFVCCCFLGCWDRAAVEVLFFLPAVDPEPVVVAGGSVVWRC